LLAEKDRLLLANSKGEGSKDDSSEVKRLKERVKIVEEALRAMRDEVRPSKYLYTHSFSVVGAHFFLHVNILGNKAYGFRRIHESFEQVFFSATCQPANVHMYGCPTGLSLGTRAR
jgi:hypothetical protein